MKTALIVISLCLFLTSCKSKTPSSNKQDSSLQMKRTIPKAGVEIHPPSLDVLRKNVLYHTRDLARYRLDIEKMKILGIHKKREGAYLVITDQELNSCGTPYHLLRLESNKWVLSLSCKHGYSFITD